MLDLGTCGNNEMKAEWMVFPNPIFDKFTINYNGINGLRNIEISISDVQGSIVLNKFMVISNGQIELSLSEYPDGVYTLSIRTGDRVDVLKLIKL
jgi:hypothetical protein